MMNAIGGTSIHYWAQSWRLKPWDFRTRSESIRRYLLSLRGYIPPPDLVVAYDDIDAIAILGGTVLDEETRARLVEAAGNIQGVERVDDRMVSKA